MASELSFDRPPSPLQRHPLPESSVMKLTRGHSCVLCQQRKVRCDKQKPCANCVKAQVECRVVPPQPPRRRKKKPHERDLIDRLRKYETLLSQHGVNFDPIAHDLKALDHGDDVADLEQDLSGLKTSPSSAADHVTPEGGNDKHKWYPYYKDFRATDEMLHDSSDEDYEGPTLHHAYDTMFENNDGFPFVVGGTQASVTNAHPSAIQVFQLWQIYINNVNPLLKLSHISTLQAQIISASANPGKIAKPLEALMFAIYFSAITSMTEEEAQSTFGEDRAILLNKFHAATQQALVNAGFMRSTELMVLQALFLYLLCARPYVDPRSLFCLIGIAVRIATRIGIHRDGALFNLPPFETEQRRRLWWQIVIFDKRIAEITGSSITALSTSQGDCRFPLNINDADLNIHAKDPPTPYHGPTEMLFCLTRVELTVAAAPNGSQQAATPGGSVNPHKQTRVHYSPSPSSPDIVTHVAQQNLPHNLVTFCQYIEDVYLKQCDSKIPLHLFTLLMTQQALSKLRVVDFLCRGVATDSVEPAERDALFTEAIRMVELDNALQTDATLQGFRWYTYQHFPLPAYIFLVSELRQRPTGELSERAWNVMVENCEHRGFTKHMRSPMHILLGHFFVKAWDTREAAEAQLGRQLMAPKIVTLLRSNMSRYKKPNSAPSSSSGGVSGPSQMPPSAGLSGGGGVPVQPDSIPGGGGLYSANKPMPDAPPPPPPPPQHMGSTNNSTSMMMDDNMVYSGFDGVSQIINNAPMGEVDFNQMDWNYLVQYGSFGGFNPNIYHPPPLGQHGGPQ